MSERTPFFPAREHRLRLGELGVLDRRRTVVGFVLAVLIPAAIEVVATRTAHANFSLVMLAQLAGAVVVALVGGLWPAVAAAVTATLALNWFSTHPVGSFSIADPQAVAELAVFLAISVAVGLAVGASVRRYEQAIRAAAEADAMSELALGILGSTADTEEFLERVRTTLGLRAVSLLARAADDAGHTPSSAGPPARRGREASGWTVLATAGDAPPVTHAAADDAVAPDGWYTLLAAGRRLDAGERRMMQAFGAYLVAMRQRGQLALSREDNRRLEEGNRIRTSILRAVSHDLRTPLAGIKLSVSSLRQPGIAFAPEEETELLATIEDYTDRLALLVDNLLDMSRITADTVRPLLRPVAWRDVIPAAVTAPDRLVDLIPANAPPVRADPVLLERVVANLVENALRYAPGELVELTARSGVPGPDGTPTGQLLVVDHGAGVPPEDILAMFRPFQRLDDAPAHGGIGLGLAVAKGFIEAMGGRIEAEETPGGGLTMLVSLPLSEGNQA
ncbi:sensor histidine kinase [Sinomonas halotolerans]|uniref:histidine kinase n=1 Tax=Sinomonas halotolerans TaxID=1644133 RepID=A0ABU9WY52_9MICC